MARFVICAALLLSCALAPAVFAHDEDPPVLLYQDDIILDPGGSILKISTEQGIRGPGEFDVLRSDVAVLDYTIRSEDEATEYKRMTIKVSRYWGERFDLKIERDDGKDQLRFFIDGNPVGLFCDPHVNACQNAGLPGEFDGTIVPGTCKVWITLGSSGIPCPAGKIKLKKP